MTDDDQLIGEVAGGYCGIRHAPSKADRQFVFPTEFGSTPVNNQTSPKSRYVGKRRIQSRCFGNGGFVTGYGRIPATVEPSLLDFLEPYYQDFQ